MTSVAAKRRRRKAAQAGDCTQAGATRQTATQAPTTHHTARPTPERWARGIWAEAAGAGKEARPLVDLASDMVGRLYATKQITSAQHDAARMFQELRQGYLKELGARGFKSCLAGGVGGYDATDGDVAAVRAYRSMERKIGSAHCAVLMFDLEQINGTPRSIDRLRLALDAIAG